ncbi:hypothetical protein OKW50_008321 [Paraburkholderia youngii]|uniref:hypothetical protein n=1 Tax=Paraburkholderia youngii TaxID=2782701 RepID=UPI003D19A09E
MNLPERIEKIFSNPKSAYTRVYGMTLDQFSTWGQGLVALGLLDEDDLDSAIPYWNLLCGIYVLTQEEGESITATEACLLTGKSKRNGQRYLGPAEDAGVVLLTPVKGDKKQKNVTLSPEAAKLVKATIDSWATEYETLSKAVIESRRHRSRKIQTPEK